MSRALKARQLTGLIGLDNTDELESIWSEWQEKLDARGVTIVCSAGNRGYNPQTGMADAYMADNLPRALVNDNSPVIAVGGTYADGSLWEYSNPSGARPGQPASDAVISVYAQAAQVEICQANWGEMGAQVVDGTSVSAAQVVSASEENRAFQFL